jgi:hypothetical protein
MPLFDTLTLCRDNPIARATAALRRRRAIRITPLQPHLAARAARDLAAPAGYIAGFDHAARHARVMRRTTVAGTGPAAQPLMATRDAAWDGIIPEGVGAAF